MGNKNCGCTPTIVVPVNEISGQGCCTPKQSCCSQSLPATPCAPVSCLPACQEDHSKTYICNQFSAVIKVSNSWNVPDCGGSAILQVSGLSNILIGSYIWTVEYGYYEVIGFNANNGQVTVQNNCNDGNAPVGTQVPGCVEFVVIDPPVSSGGGGGQPSLFPYVAIDFTAPAVGDCLDITVTTVNGLAVGKNVQIGSGTYRLESIPSSTIIRICNDGDGIVPGTPVIAQNAQGQYQYPVILIDTNPCTNTPSSSGALIVCDGGVAKPLDGATVGSVPVLIDATTNEVEFQPLNAPTRTCTIITCCLTIVPGVANYTIPVADSSQFTVGDILQIGTRTDRFTVTNIPDATHLTGTLDPVPGGSIVEIAVGTSICIVDCCELLQNQIDDIDVEITALQATVSTHTTQITTINTTLGDIFSNAAYQVQAPPQSAVLNAGSPTFDGAIQLLSINNPTDVTMNAYFTIEMFVNALSRDANTDELSVIHRIIYDFNTPIPVSVFIFEQENIFTTTDGETGHTRNIVHSQVFSINANSTLDIYYRADIDVGATGAAEYEIVQVSMRASYVGIAT